MARSLSKKLFGILQDFRRSQDLFLQRVPEAEGQIHRLAAEIDGIAALVRSLIDELRPASLDNAMISPLTTCSK